MYEDFHPESKEPQVKSEGFPWELVYLVFVMVIAIILFFGFSSRMVGAELPKTPHAPLVKIIDDVKSENRFLSYKEGALESKRTGKPLITYVGNVTKRKVEGLVIAWEAVPQADWWPRNGCVISTWVSNREWTKNFGNPWPFPLDQLSEDAIDDFVGIIRITALNGKAVVNQPLRSSISFETDFYHTHTCSKGHTWDHSQDGGSHRCPVCGEYQNVVDSFPKIPLRTLGSSGCGPNGCPTSGGYRLR